MNEQCSCCGDSAPKRGTDDPWEGRLDGYCYDCSLARCDAYPGTCGKHVESSKAVETWKIWVCPVHGPIDWGGYNVCRDCNKTGDYIEVVRLSALLAEREARADLQERYTDLAKRAGCKRAECIVLEEERDQLRDLEQYWCKAYGEVSKHHAEWMARHHDLARIVTERDAAVARAERAEKTLARWEVLGEGAHPWGDFEGTYPENARRALDRVAAQRDDAKLKLKQAEADAAWYQAASEAFRETAHEQSVRALRAETEQDELRAALNTFALLRIY